MSVLSVGEIMTCPKELTALSPKQCVCGCQGWAIDSRQQLTHVRRRYRCDCGERWTTYEVRCQDDNPEVVLIRQMKDEMADRLIAAAQKLMG